MSTNETKAPKERTFYCIWPEHKTNYGEPEMRMTAMGERGFYSRSQRIQFVNQRFTTSDPEIIAWLEAECKRQPMVFSTKWMPNPVLARRDDAEPPSRAIRGAAATTT